MSSLVSVSSPSRTSQPGEEPAIVADGIVKEVDAVYDGKHRIVTEPLKMSSSPVSHRQPAPAPGEHTIEVLKELGRDRRPDARRRGLSPRVEQMNASITGIADPSGTADLSGTLRVRFHSDDMAARKTRRSLLLQKSDGC
jgi:hypothetical protein